MQWYLGEGCGLVNKQVSEVHSPYTKYWAIGSCGPSCSPRCLHGDNTTISIWGSKVGSKNGLG